MTGRTEQAADQPRAPLEPATWCGVKGMQHRAHLAPVVPLFIFDLTHALAFGRIAQRLPVTAVGMGRSQLARVGVLQDDDEFTQAGLGVQAGYRWRAQRTISGSVGRLPYIKMPTR